MSDIIVLQWRGEVSSHYVDSAGFVELESFIGEERKIPQIAETAAHFKEPSESEIKPPDNSASYSQLGNKPDGYSGPTVAELESDVKAGKSISLLDLSKAANAENKNSRQRKGRLMERLAEGKRRAAQHGQAGMDKPNERRQRE